MTKDGYRKVQLRMAVCGQGWLRMAKYGYVRLSMAKDGQGCLRMSKYD